MNRVKLRAGDMVMVRSGKSKGKTGKVIAVHPKLNKVTVEGLNLAKRHLKPTREKPQGGIVEITKPMPVSKLGIYDSAHKKASRIGYKVDKSGRKVRVMRSSGKEIK